MGPNTDSFKDKLWLAVLDKLVLALAAGLILFLIQNWNTERDKKNARIRDLTQTYSDILRKSVTDIQTDAVELLIAVEELENSSDESTFNANYKKLLSLKIRSTCTLEIVSTFIPNINDKKIELSNSILSLAKITYPPNRDNIKSDEDNFKKKYREFIDHVKDNIRIVIDKEYGIK